MASYCTITMPDHILLVAYWTFRSRTALPHPPCSPDKNPYDFWLFPQFKKPLQGKRFASNKKWTELWDKCTTWHGILLLIEQPLYLLLGLNQGIEALFSEYGDSYRDTVKAYVKSNIS
ncbi:UNVERIFIED_CONTAM: hypothetical protein NCL1_17039 [Trichonephila clavipes]